MNHAGWISVCLVGLGGIIVAVVVFSRRSGGKQRSKARVKGFGLSVDAESSSDLTPGVRVDDASSSEGGLKAEDKTGRGVVASRVQTKTDILLTNTPPQEGIVPKI